MLKLFRRIRQNLIREGRLSRYFIYALSEILLVVIGILIALQINNWNEYRQDRQRESDCLIGIKIDLEQDLETLQRLDGAYQRRLAFYHKINPAFYVSDEIKSLEIDTTIRYLQLFYRLKSFRKTEGTYRSIISDGQSHIIRNKKLFNKLQKVYDEQYARLQSMYQTLTSRGEEISWKWSKEISYPTLQNDFKITDKDLLADLNWFHNIIRFHHSQLNVQKELIIDVLNVLNMEMKNK